MLRILILGDNPLVNTGYSITLREIADSFLEAGCEIQQIAFGLYEQQEYIYKLHHVPTGDFFGKTIFQQVVDQFLPHIVFTFNDVLNTSWVSLYKDRFFKWVNYFPVDSDHITVAQKHIIMQCDQPIVYSKSALNIVLNETKREDLKIIYHGIDTEKFIPLNKEDVKKKYGMSDKFIVGTVGRNNTRKNFPALMEAFSEFAKDKNDVYLYIHSNPIDVGHNLYEYIKMFNLSNKVLITQDMDLSGLNDEQLVELYSTFDIYVSSTSGEGLGLPILEAQACGVPVLVTDFSACREFVPKDMRIKLAGHYFEGGWDTKRVIIDQSDLVDKLNKMYYNRNIIPVIGEKGRKFIEGFDWKYIKPLWVYFIKLYAEQQFGIKTNDDSNTFSKFIKI